MLTAPPANVRLFCNGLPSDGTSLPVSDLLRRGLNASTPAQAKDGLVVFHLPADSPKVTTDDVRRIEAEGA